MDSLISPLVDKVFNEAGLVAILLFLSVIYLIRVLTEERKEHRATIEKVFSLVDQSNEADKYMTDALRELRWSIEHLPSRMRQ